MSKICPINMNTRPVLCTTECAWRVGENCAIVDIANSFKRREIQREVMSKFANMKYGMCSDKHIDTDTIRKEVFD